MKIMSVGKVGRPKKVPKHDKEYYRQFFEKHVQEDDSGCHLWTAAKNNIGYGMFRYINGMATAHRSIMDMNGHNIEDKVVYHTCDNYDCVNPQHLKVGTLLDKAQVMTSKGRAGKTFTDPSTFKTCPHCGYHGNKAVLGHVHNDKCKHKTVGK